MSDVSNHPRLADLPPGAGFRTLATRRIGIRYGFEGDGIEVALWAREGCRARRVLLHPGVRVECRVLLEAERITFEKSERAYAMPKRWRMSFDAPASVPMACFG